MTGTRSQSHWPLPMQGGPQGGKRVRKPGSDTLRAFGVAAVSSTMLWALILVATGLA
jgi:hypothetical protein